VQKRPISDHDYDTPSLEYAYAGNMRHMQHICAAYFAKFCIFSCKKFRIFQENAPL